MQREEITRDISEDDDSPETIDDISGDDSQEEDVQNDDPKETSDPDPEPEETSTDELSIWERDDLKEVVVKKDTIQKREEISDLDSSLEDLTDYSTNTTSYGSDLAYDSDVFEQILAEQQTANALFVRITNQNDLFLGIGIALIICCICYSVLERFTRF